MIFNILSNQNDKDRMNSIVTRLLNCYDGKYISKICISTDSFCNNYTTLKEMLYIAVLVDLSFNESTDLYDTMYYLEEDNNLYIDFSVDGPDCGCQPIYYIR